MKIFHHQQEICPYCSLIWGNDESYKKCGDTFIIKFHGLLSREDKLELYKEIEVKEHTVVASSEMNHNHLLIYERIVK